MQSYTVTPGRSVFKLIHSITCWAFSHLLGDQMWVSCLAQRYFDSRGVISSPPSPDFILLLQTIKGILAQRTLLCCEMKMTWCHSLRCCPGSDKCFTKCMKLLFSVRGSPIACQRVYLHIYKKNDN